MLLLLLFTIGIVLKNKKLTAAKSAKCPRFSGRQVARYLKSRRSSVSARSVAPPRAGR